MLFINVYQFYFNEPVKFALIRLRFFKYAINHFNNICLRLALVFIYILTNEIIFLIYNIFAYIDDSCLLTIGLLN